MKLPENTLATEPQVEMIPLIDVVFLVLVAFIYASMFMTYKTGLSVDLPESSQAETVMSEVLTLTIMRDGSLFLNEDPVTPELLSDTLSTAKTVSGEKPALYVMADGEARLDPLIKIMDLARKAGITSLTIATEKQVNATGKQ